MARFLANPLAGLRLVGDVLKLADEVVKAFDDGRLTPTEAIRLGEAFVKLALKHRLVGRA